MAEYQNLRKRIDAGDVIVLDGAVGTQLQDMGVPMDSVAWCGPANVTHPSSVVQMPERYVRAGADIITTNTFSTVRPMLENAGYGGMVREVNARAAHLAQEARDRTAGDRPVYIAGSISSHITGRNSLTGEIGIGASWYQGGPGIVASFPADELEDYYTEMADILAEAGVDFFLVEPMGQDNEARLIQAQAAKNTGLPVWVGFDAHVGADETVLLGNPMQSTATLRAGARPINENMTLREAIAEVRSVEPDVMAVFHSRIDDTTAGLRVMQEEWSGPMLAYPDAGRADYVETWQDRSLANEESPGQFTEAARQWIGMGVQIVGACCGFGADYIQPLRGALPSSISSPRTG